MEIVEIKKNIYIAYKSETSRYLAYILYLYLRRRKNLNVYYDKACIEVSDTWRDILNTSLNKSNVCLIVGEKGSFDSLKKGKHDNDKFLDEVSFAIEKREKKQSEIMYLAVEGYKPWEDTEIKTEPCIQRLEKYQGLVFHFNDKTERLIKEEIREVVRRCEDLCKRGYHKSLSIQSPYEGQKEEANITSYK